jgi:hypothetical protein
MVPCTVVVAAGTGGLCVLRWALGLPAAHSINNHILAQFLALGSADSERS